MNLRVCLKMKKANILMGNIVYIILVVSFIAILFIFVLQQSSNVGLLEERTAKQIALAIDASLPGTQMNFNFDEVLGRLDQDYVSGNLDNIVSIEGNKIVVKFSSNSFKEYGFFSDFPVDVELGSGDPHFLKVVVGRHLE